MDAAGHCLPLTGEGIRPAVFFAQQLAALLNAQRSGTRTRTEVEREYRALQARYARRYRWLRVSQRVLRGWPDPPVGWFFRAYAGRGRLYRTVPRGVLGPGCSHRAARADAGGHPATDGGQRLTLTVLLFARLREIAGEGRLRLEVGEDSSPRAVFEALGRSHPALRELETRVRCAVDLEYCDWDAPLHDGAEVAFIPPTAGG